MANGILKFGLNTLDKGFWGSEGLRNFIKYNTKCSGKKLKQDSVDELTKYFYQKMIKRPAKFERTPSADYYAGEKEILNTLSGISSIQ